MATMEKQEDYFSQNEKELMEYFGYSGSFGLLKLLQQSQWTKL